MKLEDLLLFEKERLVVERLLNSQNPIVFYGAANCADSLYHTLAQYDRAPDAVFVDDAFYKDEATFHGIKIERFDQVCCSLPLFDVAVAIGTKYPNIAFLERQEQVQTCFFNVGYARGLAMDEMFVGEQWDGFRDVFNLLEDELSKRSLVAFLKNKMYGDLDGFARHRSRKQYFGLEIMPLSSKETLVDCGAYTGDSLQSFLEVVGGRYAKIYAWEPDPKNVAELERYIRTASLNDVVVVPYCAYENKGTVSFDVKGSETSFVSTSGSNTILCDTIDNICGDATLIKLDVEGSEAAVLLGARETIAKRKPKLAVAIYHRREDVIDIPRIILSLRDDYRFYLRLHRDVADDVILYAV